MTVPQTPDYLAIGHITIDLLPDGGQALGGSALYAALTAARFGLRAAILTRGDFARAGRHLDEALRQVAAEVEIIAQSASAATTFRNTTIAGRRHQEIHAWAGPIDVNGLPPAWRSARVVHLAPVAQEIEPRQVGRLHPGYLGATPQGWMRQWSPARDGLVSLEQLRLPPDTLSRIDALVLSSSEQSLARDAIDAVSRRGLVAITRGAEPAHLIDRGRSIEIPAYPVRVVDDTGAGDVFAAVLFLLRADVTPVSVAARTAAAAAALRLQSGIGPEAIPTRAQVEEFLAVAEQSARGRRP
ncbi:MAG TPA: PfkB family carbohydrate kinase [Thermomicrobiaceae bacterium]|nr:PfkB family carbohydrate kinase [Thermomicrobiaceae bacterium]